MELEPLGGPIILTSNLNTEDIKRLQFKDSFIKEEVTIWKEANFEDRVISENQFLKQKLWHNSLIRIDITHPSSILSGITKA